jgi:hypothetical protein
MQSKNNEFRIAKMTYNLQMMEYNKLKSKTWDKI